MHKLSQAKTKKLRELMEKSPDNAALTYAVELLDWSTDGNNASDPPTPPGGPPNP